jgi:ABC-type thiamin/hydroxymethylpyrimidine transport system permease subunit
VLTSTSPAASGADPAPAARTVEWPALLAAALAVGLLGGALTSVGQTLFGAGPLAGLANAVSPWLLAPFVVGALARRPGAAALAGLLACAGEVAGYYLTAELRGFAVGSAAILLWTVAGALGGPVFGLAGRLWRTGRTGDPRWAGAGAALLAGCWLAEALVTYLAVLRRPDQAAVFAVVAALLVVLLGRGGDRRALLTRLPAAVVLGAAGFAALHLALS